MEAVRLRYKTAGCNTLKRGVALAGRYANSAGNDGAKWRCVGVRNNPVQSNQNERQCQSGRKHRQQSTASTLAARERTDLLAAAAINFGKALAPACAASAAARCSHCPPPLPPHRYLRSTACCHHLHALWRRPLAITLTPC